MSEGTLVASARNIDGDRTIEVEVDGERILLGIVAKLSAAAPHGAQVASMTPASAREIGQAMVSWADEIDPEPDPCSGCYDRPAEEYSQYCSRCEPHEPDPDRAWKERRGE